MYASESTNATRRHNVCLRSTDPCRLSAWNTSDANGRVSAALLDLVAQGALVLDSGGRILSCNDRFASMVGIPSPVILHSSLDDYLSPRHTAAVRSLPVLEDVLSETESDLALRRADGSVIPVRVSVTALATDGTGRENVGAFFTDRRDAHASHAKIITLTEQVAHEIDRRKTAEERASAMEAVGQIASGIAHDLNNFLQVIGNSLELLGRRTAGDAQIARLSGAAQHALLRAAKLSQQLLTFSRGQELQLERVSLDELMPSIRSLLDRALPDSVSLRIEPMTAVWPCVTDLYRLESVLLNLAINARDAMPDGGLLELAVENRQIGAGCASAWGVVPGDYLMIRVSDTGTGMSPEIAARAFEPFFTTKVPGKGTGLGLSQVYTFAKRSSGFVTIESAVGHGSRVLLFLPRGE